jgi:lipopolysaccharide export system permease protein
MKKTIYKYFFSEFIRYFTITLFALAIIIWTIQAVNFLDLITDDGHAFRVYFFYSFLTISKVFTKLIPFCFLISTVLTILKLEKDNELIVLWTSGLNKINITNLIFRISLIIMLVQVSLTTVINPQLLNISRTLLKNSELQFIPSIFRERQFNDTIEGLTVFVEKKSSDKSYENILIHDEGKILSKVGTTSSTIIAKSGNISEDEKSLILSDGTIQNIGKNGEISIVKFSKTSLNLSGIATKSISEPKLQETSTAKILSCIKNNNINLSMHNCAQTKKSYMDTKIEINKRFGMPIYIPLISLICCFLLTSRKDKKIYSYYKYIYFFIGFIFLIFSEITVRFSGISWNHTYAYYLSPLIMSPIIYLALIKTFKYENLS